MYVIINCLLKKKNDNKLNFNSVALKLPKEFNLPIYSNVNIIPPVGATVSLFGYSKISYQHTEQYVTSTFRQNDGGPVYKQGIVAHSLVQTADEQKYFLVDAPCSACMSGAPVFDDAVDEYQKVQSTHYSSLHAEESARKRLCGVFVGHESNLILFFKIIFLKNIEII